MVGLMLNNGSMFYQACGIQKRVEYVLFFFWFKEKEICLTNEFKWKVVNILKFNFNYKLEYSVR